MTDLKIFLVEDDDILAKTTEWRVRKMGYDFVGRAANGKDAIERISEMRPDIILMDVHLPGEMDGIVTADIITRSYHIPVIFLTSAMDKETLSRAREVGPKGYLVKPYDNKDLMAAIELAIQ